MATERSINAGGAFIEISSRDAKLQAGLQNAQKHISDFAKNTATILSGMNAGMNIGKAVLSPVISTVVEFDRQIRMAGAISGASAEQFQKLSDKARDVGQSTAFTAGQAASAMTALARSGFSPEDMRRALDGVVNLSLATGTDLAQSADIAANSMRIFGLQASDMNHVADVLTATANGSAQTLGDLYEALTKVGPQAAATGGIHVRVGQFRQAMGVSVQCFGKVLLCLYVLFDSLHRNLKKGFNAFGDGVKFDGGQRGPLQQFGGDIAQRLPQIACFCNPLCKAFP